MINVWSDRSLIKSGEKHVEILIPFWGEYSPETEGPDCGRYEKWHAHGKNIFSF